MFTHLDAELYVKLSPLTDADHRYVVRCRNNPIQRFKVSFNTQLSTIASYVLGRMGGQGVQNAGGSFSSGNNSCFNNNYNMNNGFGQNSYNSMNVTLSVQRLGSFVSVPLSITISDLMMMTSMNDEALLFYSFDQSSQQQIPSQNPTNSTIDNQIENSYNQSFPMPLQEQFQNSPLSPPSQMHSISTSPYSPSMMFSTPKIRNNSQQQFYNSNLSSFSSPPVVKNQKFSSPNWSEVPTSPSCTLFHTGISMYADSFGTMPPSFGLNQSSNSFSNSFSSSVYDEEQSTESIKLRQSLEAMIHRSSQVNSC